MPRKNEKSIFNSHLVLDEKIKEISVGLIISDATLQTQSNGKFHRIKIQMSNKFTEFAQKIRDEFGPLWIPSPASAVKNRPMLELQTLSTCSLNLLAPLFLNSVDPDKVVDFNGKYKKGISANLVEDHVTPLGLTYWFMYDGSKGDWGQNQGKQIEFHAQAFSLLEVESLCEGLKNKFKLQAKTTFNKKRPIIQISGYSYETFVDLIDPYILDCFRYRLPTPRKIKP